MWETLFDPSMLDSGKEIAIWCPREEDMQALFEILSSRGYRWVDEDPLDSTTYSLWQTFGEDTVYRAWDGKFVSYTDLAVASEESQGMLTCRLDSQTSMGSTEVEVGDLI